MEWSGQAPTAPVLDLAKGGRIEDKEHALSRINSGTAVIGIDIGKNPFRVVGHDQRGAIVLRHRWSRGRLESRLANLPPCLIGMEACVGAHHLGRKLASTRPQGPADADQIGAAV